MLETSAESVRCLRRHFYECWQILLTPPLDNRSLPRSVSFPDNIQTPAGKVLFSLWHTGPQTGAELVISTNIGYQASTIAQDLLRTGMVEERSCHPIRVFLGYPKERTLTVYALATRPDASWITKLAKRFEVS